MTDPRQIYQAVLDKLSRAIMSGDDALFLENIAAPHYVETASEKIVIATLDDARDKFHIWSLTLRSGGITDYLRTCEEARFEGPDRIIGLHGSRLMRGSEEAMPSFPSSLDLENIDGVWKVRRVIQHADYVTWPDLLPRVCGADNAQT
ncbi:MAG: hypothetical protein JJ938_06740 [Roseicyclus sp.]|nr:hypothetical protein [Roseicyclus sp.]MBO6624559.1 hypothetical protein [Roseicyclus sp.]MBO6922036.1 hypothetical protein [Roseicyclus sp.]